DRYRIRGDPRRRLGTGVGSRPDDRTGADRRHRHRSGAFSGDATGHGCRHRRQPDPSTGGRPAPESHHPRSIWSWTLCRRLGYELPVLLVRGTWMTQIRIPARLAPLLVSALVSAIKVALVSAVVLVT